MKKGDLTTKLIWKCGHCGKLFIASPRLILLGGHWCPHCYIPHAKWDYDSIAKSNLFFAQVLNQDHNPYENNVYDFHQIFNDKCFLMDPLHPFNSLLSFLFSYNLFKLVHSH